MNEKQRFKAKKHIHLGVTWLLPVTAEKLSPQWGGWALRPASQPLGAENFGKIKGERGENVLS